MVMKKCPVCGVSVKLENLERHVKNQHPRAAVDVRSAISAEEAREIEAAKRPAGPVITAKGTRTIAIVAVGVAAIILIAIFNPFRGVGPSVGQMAPDFTLTTSSGGSITLSSYRGAAPVFLEFMDINCIYCIQEAENTLPALYSAYSASARFISVEIKNVAASEVESFRSRYGTTWPYGMDTTGATSRAYGVDVTPYFFIIDRNGIVSAVFRGVPSGGYAAYANALNAVSG